MPTAQYRRQAALDEMRRRSMQRRNRHAVALGVGWTPPRNPATLLERLGFYKPTYGAGNTVQYNF